MSRAATTGRGDTGAGVEAGVGIGAGAVAAGETSASDVVPAAVVVWVWTAPGTAGTGWGAAGVNCPSITSKVCMNPPAGSAGALGAGPGGNAGAPGAAAGRGTDPIAVMIRSSRS